MKSSCLALTSHHLRWGPQGSAPSPPPPSRAHSVTAVSGRVLPTYPKEVGFGRGKLGGQAPTFTLRKPYLSSGHGSSCQDFGEAGSAFRVAPSASQRATWELKP